MPKEWVKQVGIKPQSQVTLVPLDDLSILIVPQVKIDKLKLKVSLEYQENTDRDFIVRDFISYYLSGYEVIRVKFKGNDTGAKKFLKELLRKKVIGVEIIEETSNELAIQCLPAYVELPLKKVLNRMFILASSMHIDAILSLNGLDYALASDVIERDDEIDRFYFFA